MACSFDNCAVRVTNSLLVSKIFSVVDEFSLEKLIVRSLTIVSPLGSSTIIFKSTELTSLGGLEIILALLGSNLIQFGSSWPSFKTIFKFSKLVFSSYCNRKCRLTGKSTTCSLPLRFDSNFKNSLGFIVFTISFKDLLPSLRVSVTVLFTDPFLSIELSFTTPSLFTSIFFTLAIFLFCFITSLSLAIFLGSITTVTCFLLLSTSIEIILNS